MIGWLKNLNDASRLTSINEASRISGISAKAIEKDWWVTLSLKLLFNTANAKHFAFKGGTSLSKGWQLIDRFSEDIDISLSSEAVGIAYAEKPSKTFVEQLRRAGCSFTSNELLEALKTEFRNSQVPQHLYSIEAESVRADMPDKDPQTLYVNYVSLFDPNPYLPDRVKIEFCVRIIPSDDVLNALDQDYEIMKEEMIYGNPPTFEEIIQAMKNLQDKINGEN